MFGQELNPESYAICKADMLIKGRPVENIALGNTLSADALGGKQFDYMLSNPPRLGWSGRGSSVRSAERLRSRATTGASGLGCLE